MDEAATSKAPGESEDDRQEPAPVQGDEAAREAGSVDDDVTEPDRPTDAIEDLVPGDSDGDGH